MTEVHVTLVNKETGKVSSKATIHDISNQVKVVKVKIEPIGEESYIIRINTPKLDVDKHNV